MDAKKCEFCNASMYFRHDSTVCKACDKIMADEEKQLRTLNKKSYGRKCRGCSLIIKGPNYFFCNECQANNWLGDQDEYSIPGLRLR